MPKLKLTETSVKDLAAPDPSGKQRLYWDTAHKGFGVLCSGVTNAKSYVVERDVKGSAAASASAARMSLRWTKPSTGTWTRIVMWTEL